MTSDGRYYTTSAYTIEILEWAPDGTFLRAVGKTGEGPGEFSPRGGPLLFMGPADTLFVLDGAHRWHLFDPELNFQRTFVGRYNGRNPATMHLIAGEGIVTTAVVAGAGLAVASSGSELANFHSMNFDG